MVAHVANYLQTEKQSAIIGSRVILPKRFEKELQRILLTSPIPFPEDDLALHAHLRHLVGDRAPSLWALAQEVKGALQGERQFVILQGLPFLKLDCSLYHLFTLSFMTCLGNPIPTHLNSGKVVWNVKPQRSTGATFSINAEPASLHTDSQYTTHPPRYFSLVTIRPADRGGDSYILDGRVAIETLLDTADGQNCLRLLSQRRFPFRVPTIYTARECDDRPEFIYAPVVSNNPLLRFRYDVLCEGMLSNRVAMGNEMQWSIDYFHKHIEHHSQIIWFRLEAGDILLANNHELLHGRSGFSDSQRHLLRVRFD